MAEKTSSARSLASPFQLRPTLFGSQLGTAAARRRFLYEKYRFNRSIQEVPGMKGQPLFQVFFAFYAVFPILQK